MKKILFWLLSFSIIFSGLISSTNFAEAQSTSTNLITNPTVETANTASNAPQNWQTGQWGTNTFSFSYLNSGYSSSRSVKIAISKYTSGDAKWFFDPVAVKPNTQYMFSDYYISNIPTTITAYEIDGQGKESYQYLGSAPVSSAWKKAGFVFTTPANISKLSVFHLLSQVGTLQTDNFDLEEYVPLVTPDAIPNGSMEQASDLNSALPASWQTGSWGTNKATFSYLNTGHTGSHSVKISLASRTTGAAEWLYTPQPVTASQNYKYSEYYISNVVTEVDMMVNYTDGSVQYITLATLGAANTWALFSTTFVMPAGVQTASIMHIIYNNGTLQTDDYSLAPYTPQKFSRPIISLTFDDGYTSYSTTALPFMNQNNYKSTAYIISGSVGDATDGYMTLAQIKAAYTSGNEIGSHTVTHPDLDTLSVNNITAELSNSKSYLQKNVSSSITDFAAPYGDANQNVITQIKKYYATNRSVDAGYNSPDNFDPYHILVQNIDNTTTLANVQSWIDCAKLNNLWLVIVYHQVDSSNDTYSVTPSNFSSQLSAINQSGISVLTMSQALKEVTPQIVK